MKDNIVLIGMPGAGKSSIGVVLAKVMGYDFVDLDLVISKREKTTLQKIIDERGLDEFLKCEEYAATKLKCKKTIVATGGSVVLSKKGMDNLKKLGTVVFFDVSLDDLKSRIRNFETRGIACKKGDTLDDVYNDRIDLYKNYADFTVDCSKKEINDVIDSLKKLLNIA